MSSTAAQMLVAARQLLASMPPTADSARIAAVRAIVNTINQTPRPQRRFSEKGNCRAIMRLSRQVLEAHAANQAFATAVHTYMNTLIAILVAGLPTPAAAAPPASSTSAVPASTAGAPLFDEESESSEVEYDEVEYDDEAVEAFEVAASEWPHPAPRNNVNIISVKAQVPQEAKQEPEPERASAAFGTSGSAFVKVTVRAPAPPPPSPVVLVATAVVAPAVTVPVPVSKADRAKVTAEVEAAAAAAGVNLYGKSLSWAPGDKRQRSFRSAGVAGEVRQVSQRLFYEGRVSKYI